MSDPFQVRQPRLKSLFLRFSIPIYLFGLCPSFPCAAAFAAEKPLLSPDQPAPLTTTSHVSATIEFGIPGLASAIERDIPRRLATVDERIRCVHRRVLVFRIKANCDVSGFVDRGRVSLDGRGDHVVGGVPIFGTVEGQGANRFTSHIHGNAEGRAIVEAEVRPQLRRNWSLDLHFSDSLRWSEPPILHVLGRDIPLTKYAEPSIRNQLGRIRARAQEAARRLDLHDKAAKAWKQAFEPIQIADDPQVWFQLTPQSAAFAGVRANAKTLSGSLEFSGSAQTLVGEAPSPVTPMPLPPLGTDVNEPGRFDIILPVRVNYDALREKVMQAAAASKGETAVRDIEIYPSSGKLVVGLRVAKFSETDSAAGEWIYLSGTLNVDPDKRSVRLSDLAADGSVAANSDGTLMQSQVLNQLKQIGDVSYGVAYQNLLNAANERLNRHLKNGYRMEGQLTSAKLDKILLLADGLQIALRASGDLKILYGL